MAGAPQATQSVPTEDNRGAAEFAGIMRNSIKDNSQTQSAENAQPVDLKQVKPVELSAAEAQPVDWQVLQATDNLPESIELEIETLGALVTSELDLSSVELDADTELSLLEVDDLPGNEGGTILPPFAVDGDIELVDGMTAALINPGALPQANESLMDDASPDELGSAGLIQAGATLEATDTVALAAAAGLNDSNVVKTAGQASTAIQSPGAATATALSQASLNLDGQSAGSSSNGNLQQAMNAVQSGLSDSTAEQSAVEFRANTVPQGGQSTAPLTSAAGTAAAGATASMPSGTVSPLIDANPVSLQSMSLGKGETSSDIGNSLADRVQWMINHRQNTANIRLDPPLLGRLDVQVKVVDDVATITIQTQQGMTRDMIDAASHRLRDALQESGFESVNVDVSHREDTDQANNQQFADEPSAGSMTGQNSETEMIADSAPPQTWIAEYTVSGLVDTFA